MTENEKDGKTQDVINNGIIKDKENQNQKEHNDKRIDSNVNPTISQQKQQIQNITDTVTTKQMEEKQEQKENKTINSTIIANLKTSIPTKTVQTNNKEQNIMNALNKNQINDNITISSKIENQKNITDIQNKSISI